MLDRLAACTHRLRIFIEPLLRGFENVLVLPAWNASLVARRAFRFQQTMWAGVRPITPHHLAILLGRHAIAQLLAGRTAIDILGGIVDEVLLAETTIRLRTRCHWLRQRHRNASIIASLDLRAVVVTAIDRKSTRLNSSHLGISYDVF